MLKDNIKDIKELVEAYLEKESINFGNSNSFKLGMAEAIIVEIISGITTPEELVKRMQRSISNNVRE